MMYIPVPPDLTTFVSSHTGVRLADNMKIGVIDNASPVLGYAPAWAQGITMIAAGVENAGQVYLPVRSAVHLQEDDYRAIVVHELVHVAQKSGHRTFACDGQREAQAYEIQNLFLVENDLSPVVGDDALARMNNCQAH